ncbi:hypothetical protein TNCV_917741 [Trichonephila clavipes]|nr:hypothetical protein TNCV_917741 [Trichonephila clavipes]
MDIVAFNHALVTKMIPKLTPPSPNFQTTLTKGRFSLNIFNLHWPPLHDSDLVEWLRQQTKLPHLSEANPQVYVETSLHPEKLTVWCALWAGGILLQKR